MGKSDMTYSVPSKVGSSLSFFCSPLFENTPRGMGSVSQPGLEPGPPAVEETVLTLEPAEVPMLSSDAFLQS